MKEGALSAEVYIDETSGEISMAAYQVLGTIKGYDILLFTFDNNGDDLGPATPVEGRVIDDNTLSIWHYSAFYYNTSGQEVGVGPGYDILKSTWKRKK